MLELAAGGVNDTFDDGGGCVELLETDEEVLEVALEVRFFARLLRYWSASFVGMSTGRRGRLRNAGP